jgi:hypothetical protein
VAIDDSPLVRHILYIIGWGLVFGISTPLLGVLKGRLSLSPAPALLRGPIGPRVVFVFCCLIVANAVSLVFWGWVNLSWYMTVPEWLAGLLTSVFFQRTIKPRYLVAVGPLVLLFLNLLLWSGV